MDKKPMDSVIPQVFHEEDLSFVVECPKCKQSRTLNKPCPRCGHWNKYFEVGWVEGLQQAEIGTVYVFDKGIAWLLSKAPIWLLKVAVVLMLLLFIYESGAAVRNFTSWVWRRP